MTKHDLYKTGDVDAPDTIKDRNGEVVLALCRVCNQGEIELEPVCPGPPKPAITDELSDIHRTLAEPSPEFDAWVASMDKKLWARFDLSAARLGWEAARKSGDALVAQGVQAVVDLIAQPASPPMTPTYTRISDERLEAIWAGSIPPLEWHAIVTELRERRAQAVTVRPTYEQITDVVLACRERQKAAGEGDRMLSRWISEGIGALYASPPPAQSADAAKAVDVLPEQAPLQVAYDLRDSLNSWPGPHNLTDAQRFADRVWYAARKMIASPPAPASGGVSEAARDVLSERQRQVESEGWTPEHDDKYSHDELPLAAACYAAPEAVYWGPARDRSALRWPWQVNWWKPTNRRRDLVKAGALILAEIERLDRTAALTQPAGEEQP